MGLQKIQDTTVTKTTKILHSALEHSPTLFLEVSLPWGLYICALLSSPYVLVSFVAVTKDYGFKTT